MFGLVYALYYFNLIGKSPSAPDCLASNSSNYPVKPELTNEIIINVSQRFNTLISMGFWGYSLILFFLILYITCGIAKRRDAEA